MHSQVVDHRLEGSPVCKMVTETSAVFGKLNVRRSKALTVTAQVTEHHCTLVGTKLSWLMTQAHVYTTCPESL